MKNTQTTSSAVLHNPHGHNLGRKAPTKVQEEGKLFENNLIKSHSIGPGKKSCFMMAGCVWSSFPIFCTFSASFKKSEVSGRRRFSLTSNGDAMDAPFFLFDWKETSNGHFSGVKSVGNSRKFLINFNFGEILKEFLEFLKQLLRPRHRMARESFFFVASVVPKLSLLELFCLRQVEQ